MKEWRKNPQWSLSCCLAILLPLNDLQGELRGVVGRNVLKQQLQTGKINMPSMASTLKESGAVDFSLEEADETHPMKETNHENDERQETGSSAHQSYSTLAKLITIHEVSRQSSLWLVLIDFNLNWGIIKWTMLQKTMQTKKFVKLRTFNITCSFFIYFSFYSGESVGVYIVKVLSDLISFASACLGVSVQQW